MLETVVIVLGVLLVAAIAGVVLLAWLGHKMTARFFDFADDNADRWARSHSDLADKVLSHSDSFLDFKRINEGVEPHTPTKTIARAEPREPDQHEWKPQGGFDDEVVVKAP